MGDDDGHLAIPTRHERGADGPTPVPIIVLISVVVATHAVVEPVGAIPFERSQAFILLATVMPSLLIGQAAGPAAARLPIGPQTRLVL